MDAYDPNETPPVQSWLDLDEKQRIQLALRAHRGKFPDALHQEGANEMVHCSLHAIAETQIASQDPPETAQALQRLMGAGLERHAAIHAVMLVLLEHLSSLLSKEERFDRSAYAAALAELTPVDAVDVPRNRAQRRRSRRKRGRRKR